jgi:hypothetical protein
MGLWRWLTESVYSEPPPKAEYVQEVEPEEPERIDRLFGALLRRSGQLRGECSVDGMSFEVSFEGRDDALEASLAVGRAFWPGATAWARRAREMLVEEFYDTAKDWAENEDATLTVEQFNDAVTPTTFVFDADGGVTLHFDDGDLFGGHFLTVWGVQEAPEAAEMWG